MSTKFPCDKGERAEPFGPYHARVTAVTSYLGAWDLALVPATALLAVAGAYLAGVVRVRQVRGTVWPRRRTVPFLAGVALLAVAVVGPVGAWDDTFFWDHMVQHMIMTIAAVPLIVFGAPVLLLLEASSPALRRRVLVPALRSRLVVLLTRPLVGWVVMAGALLGTHFTGFYNFAISHPLAHAYVEHPLYITAAFLFYYPLLGDNPVPHGPSPLVKVVSLFAMGAPMSMTGFFIYTARSVLYPAYTRVDRPFGPSPLADQQLAGALMWCVGMVIEITWVGFAVHSWLREEARSAERSDRAVLAERARTASS